MRPERWYKENLPEKCPVTGNAKQESKFAIIPFGHGPRSCIGRRVAENMVMIFLAKIVNNYKVQPIGTVSSRYTGFLLPDGEVKFHFEKR